MNSVKLIGEKDKFDLIWVDGAHGNPIVTIDIINSLNILNAEGLIMCDDVWKLIHHLVMIITILLQHLKL